MANIVSYNDIIEIFEDIAKRHYQINTMFLGKDWELENNADLQYPVLQIYPTVAKMPISTSTKSFNTIEITLHCKVFDLTEPGEENEKDVHSDTLRTAQDIVNEFSSHPYYVRSNVSLNNDINFEAFEEFEDDISAGWSFDLDLRIINQNTFCGLPIDPIPGYSANGPTSTGQIVNVQYLTCDTLPNCPTIQDLIAEDIDLDIRVTALEQGSGGGNFIPLTGTVPGSDVTGPIQFANGLISVVQSINGDDGSYLALNGQISSLTQYNTATNSQSALNLIGSQYSLAGYDTVSGVFNSIYNDANGTLQVLTNGTNSEGITGNQDFSLFYQPNSFIQKVYADNTYVPITLSTLGGLTTNIDNNGTTINILASDTNIGSNSNINIDTNGILNFSGTDGVGNNITLSMNPNSNGAQLYADDGNRFTNVDVNKFGIQLYFDDSTANKSSSFDIRENQNVAGNSTNNTFVINDGINQKGLVYKNDYSFNFTDESLVTKRWVLANAGGTSLPVNEIGFGTGSGITSSSNLTFDGSLFNLNGNANLTNTNPLITFNDTAYTAKSNIQQIQGSLQFSSNAFFDGSNWNKYESSMPSWNNYITPDSNDSFTVRRAAAGSSVIWFDMLRIDGTGTVQIPSLASNKAFLFADATGKVSKNNNYYLEEDPSFNRTWIFSPNGNQYLYNYIDNSGNGVIQSTSLQINGNNMLGLRSDSGVGYVKMYSGGGISIYGVRTDRFGFRIGDSSTLDSVSNTEAFEVSAGNIKFSNLAGSGTRMLTIDAIGILSTQAIPSLTGYVPYTGATTDLTMGAHNITAQSITANGTGGLGYVRIVGQSVTPTAPTTVGGNLFFNSSGNFCWNRKPSLGTDTFVRGFTGIITADRFYVLPDKAGTVALTSDITTALVPYLLSATAATTYQPLDSDLTAIAALTGTSGLLRTDGAGTWSVDTNSYIRSVYKDVTDSTALTGTTAQTIVKSVLIPANTFTTGDIINVKTLNTKVGVAGNCKVELYVNTTLSTSGAILTGVFLGGLNNLYQNFERTITIKNNTTNSSVFASGSTAINDFSVTSNVYTALAIDWTINQYIMVVHTNASSGDSTKCVSFVVEKH